MNASAKLPSFWMGGFDGADHVNPAGEALDMVAATGHEHRLDADYRAARRLGLSCVRESIGWRLCERPDGSFDMSRVMRMALAAQRQGVQILWTLMHYGLPRDLTLLDDALIPRFARFAGEVARVLVPLVPGPRFYTPINEIGHLSWAASTSGDVGPAGLHGDGAEMDSRISGYVIKQRLVRAALAGMAAIRAADPQARFLHVEPIVHVVPRDAGDAEQLALARRISAFQWQVFDMLAGRIAPGLGGHPGALDCLGLNHHPASQWEVPGEQRLAWQQRDPRRQPLSALLYEVWRRYGRPMLLAETGHVGADRADWLHEVAGEARRARDRGLPLEGVCLYPLLDRPDGNDTQRWHRCGLWHLPRPDGRSLNRPVARALQSWQATARPSLLTAQRPGLLVLLPCAWEDWDAPREALLQALAARPVLLLEPPRTAAQAAQLNQHALAPAAELLVLHGRDAGGWSQPPTDEQLALVREAQRRAGREHWVCWLAGWRADAHPAWWQALQGDGLILQPDPFTPPQGELLRRARGWLDARWPEPAGGRVPPQGYEVHAVEALLRGIPAPRLWLRAPPQATTWAERLRDLAAAWPGQQLLVDAPAPATALPWPPNLHWLGRVHASLHAALAAHVERIVPWDGPPGWAGLSPRDAASAPEEPMLPASVQPQPG
jgi:hypothetical protein